MAIANFEPYVSQFKFASNSHPSGNPECRHWNQDDFGKGKEGGFADWGARRSPDEESSVGQDHSIEVRAILVRCPRREDEKDEDLNDDIYNITAGRGEDNLDFHGFYGEEPIGHSQVRDCNRKLVITMKFNNIGKIKTQEVFVLIDHVLDPVTMRKSRILNPFVIKVRQEPILQLYGLKFQGVVNAEAREDVINKKLSNYTGCDDVSENPTCGQMTLDGKPIPYSQGFCCSCDPEVNSQRESDLLNKSSALPEQDLFFGSRVRSIKPLESPQGAEENVFNTLPHLKDAEEVKKNVETKSQINFNEISDLPDDDNSAKDYFELENDLKNLKSSNETRYLPFEAKKNSKVVNGLQKIGNKRLPVDTVTETRYISPTRLNLTAQLMKLEEEYKKHQTSKLIGAEGRYAADDTIGSLQSVVEKVGHDAKNNRPDDFPPVERTEYELVNQKEGHAGRNVAPTLEGREGFLVEDVDDLFSPKSEQESTSEHSNSTTESISMVESSSSLRQKYIKNSSGSEVEAEDGGRQILHQPQSIEQKATSKKMDNDNLHTLKNFKSFNDGPTPPPSLRRLETLSPLRQKLISDRFSSHNPEIDEEHRVNEFETAEPTTSFIKLATNIPVTLKNVDLIRKGESVTDIHFNIVQPELSRLENASSPENSMTSACPEHERDSTRTRRGTEENPRQTDEVTRSFGDTGQMETSGRSSSGNDSKGEAILASGSLKNQLANWLSQPETRKFEWERGDEGEIGYKGEVGVFELATGALDAILVKGHQPGDQSTTDLGVRARQIDLQGLFQPYYNSGSGNFDPNKDKRFRKLFGSHFDPQENKFASRTRSSRAVDYDWDVNGNDEQQRSVDKKIAEGFVSISEALKDAADPDRVFQGKVDRDDVFERDDSVLGRFDKIFVEAGGSDSNFRKTLRGKIQGDRTEGVLREPSTEESVRRHRLFQPDDEVLYSTSGPRINDKEPWSHIVKHTEEPPEPVSEIAQNTEHQIIVDRFKITKTFVELPEKYRETLNDTSLTSTMPSTHKVENLQDNLSTESSNERTTRSQNLNRHQKHLPNRITSPDFAVSISGQRLQIDTPINRAMPPFLTIGNLKEELRNEAQYFFPHSTSHPRSTILDSKAVQGPSNIGQEVRRVSAELTPAERVEGSIAETRPPSEDIEFSTDAMTLAIAFDDLAIGFRKVNEVRPGRPSGDLRNRFADKMVANPGNSRNGKLIVIEESLPTSLMSTGHVKKRRKRKRRRHFQSRKDNRRLIKMESGEKSAGLRSVSRIPDFQHPEQSKVQDGPQSQESINSAPNTQQIRLENQSQPPRSETSQKENQYQVSSKPKYRSMYPKSDEVILMPEPVVDEATGSEEFIGSRKKHKLTDLDDSDPLIFYEDRAIDYNLADNFNQDGDQKPVIEMLRRSERQSGPKSKKSDLKTDHRYRRQLRKAHKIRQVTTKDSNLLDPQLPVINQTDQFGIKPPGDWKDKMELLKLKKHADVLKEYLDWRHDIVPPRPQDVLGYTTKIPASDELSEPREGSAEVGTARNFVLPQISTLLKSFSTSSSASDEIFRTVDYREGSRITESSGCDKDLATEAGTTGSSDSFSRHFIGENVVSCSTPGIETSSDDEQKENEKKFDDLSSDKIMEPTTGYFLHKTGDKVHSDEEESTGRILPPCCSMIKPSGTKRSAGHHPKTKIRDTAEVSRTSGRKRRLGRSLLSIDDLDRDFNYGEGDIKGDSTVDEDSDLDTKEFKNKWNQIIEKVVHVNSSESWFSSNSTESSLPGFTGDNRAALKQLHLDHADEFLKQIAKNIVRGSYSHDQKHGRATYKGKNKSKSHFNTGRKLKSHPSPVRRRLVRKNRFLNDDDSGNYRKLQFLDLKDKQASKNLLRDPEEDPQSLSSDNIDERKEADEQQPQLSEQRDLKNKDVDGEDVQVIEVYPVEVLKSIPVLQSSNLRRAEFLNKGKNEDGGRAIDSQFVKDQEDFSPNEIPNKPDKIEPIESRENEGFKNEDPEEVPGSCPEELVESSEKASNVRTNEAKASSQPDDLKVIGLVSLERPIINNDVPSRHFNDPSFDDCPLVKANEMRKGQGSCTCFDQKNIEDKMDYQKSEPKNDSDEGCFSSGSSSSDADDTKSNSAVNTGVVPNSSNVMKSIKMKNMLAVMEFMKKAKEIICGDKKENVQKAKILIDEGLQDGQKTNGVQSGDDQPGSNEFDENTPFWDLGDMFGDGGSNKSSWKTAVQDKDKNFLFFGKLDKMQAVRSKDPKDRTYREFDLRTNATENVSEEPNEVQKPKFNFFKEINTDMPQIQENSTKNSTVSPEVTSTALSGNQTQRISSQQENVLRNLQDKINKQLRDWQNDHQEKSGDQNVLPISSKRERSVSNKDLPSKGKTKRLHLGLNRLSGDPRLGTSTNEFEVSGKRKFRRLAEGKSGSKGKKKRKKKKKRRKKKKKHKKKKERRYIEAEDGRKAWRPLKRQLMSLTDEREANSDGRPLTEVEENMIVKSRPPRRRGARRAKFANLKKRKMKKRKKGKRKKKKKKMRARSKRQIGTGEAQIRGGQDCTDRKHPPNVDPGKYLESAHCLRFSDLWYSVYELENPVIEHTVYLQLFEKRSRPDGTTRWQDLTGGSMVRMGTFARVYRDRASTVVFTYNGPRTEARNKAFNLNPTKQRLLIPSPVSPSKSTQYPEAGGGSEEFLVVPTTGVNPNGHECDKAGVGFAAFSKQPDRCFKKRGSCLRNQPSAFRKHDMEARSRGRHGCYFLSNFATVPSKPIKRNVSEHGSREYLGLEYHSSHVSTIDIEVRTDDNAIVRVGSSARLTEVYVDGTAPEHTLVTLVISNTGLASSPYQPRINDCPQGVPVSWTRARGIMQLVPAQRDQRVTLDLYGQLLLDQFDCSVELVNQRGELVAMRRIRVRKMDRCFCVWHCLCACIGSASGIGCQPMSPEHYHAAGFQGPLPLVTTETSVVMNMVKNVLMISALLVLLLLLLGILKWLVGIFVPAVGRWGLDSLLKDSRIEEYLDPELRCRCVVTNDDGWPVHPDTGQPTVRICSRKLEFILNLLFFLTYPMAVCCNYLKICLTSSKKTHCCPDESKKCLLNEKGSCPKMICVSTYGDKRNSKMEAEDTRYVMEELKKSEESLRSSRRTKIEDDKLLAKKSSHKNKSGSDVSARRLVDDLLENRIIYRNLTEPIGGLVVPSGYSYSLRGYFLNAEDGGYRFITPCPFKQYWLIEKNEKKAAKPPATYPSNLFMRAFVSARDVFECNELSLSPKGVCVNVQYQEDT